MFSYTLAGSGSEVVKLEAVSTKLVSSDEPYFTKEDVFKYILDEVKKDDDFAGTLHLTYYIATQDLVNNIGSNGFVPKTDTVNRNSPFLIDFL